MPHVKKAELIEGVVYVMTSPVRIIEHGSPHSHIIGWLVAYEAATPGVQSGDNSTVRLDMDNEPQPDGLLRVLPEFGGQSGTDQDGYVESAPELVAEVAASPASYDMHSKLNSYRRNAVQEYLVILTEERQVKWFRLREGQYVELTPDTEGVVHSEVFPGLRLDTQAFLAGNMARVLEVLQRGIATAEHAAFVERLRQAGGKRS